MNDEQYYKDLIQRLNDGGEHIRQRYPNMFDPPGFRSSPTCAQHVLNLFPYARRILVERPAGLRSIREAVINAGRQLLIPSKTGEVVLHIPRKAIGDDGVLRISPMPKCAVPYTGLVDLFVLGCHGFTPGQPKLWDLGIEKNAVRIERMEDGLDNGFQLSPSTIRVAIAADCQQLQPGEWPEQYIGCVKANAVVTPTRVINLMTGEEEQITE